MKRLLILLVALAMLAVCSSCSDQDGPADPGRSVGSVNSLPGSGSGLAGTWQFISGDTGNASMTLYSDGSCSITTRNDEVDNGTWHATGKTLRVVGTIEGRFFYADSLVGFYTLSGDELRLTRPVVDGKQSPTDVVLTRSRPEGSLQQGGSSGSADLLAGSWHL